VAGFDSQSVGIAGANVRDRVLSQLVWLMAWSAVAMAAALGVWLSRWMGSGLLWVDPLHLDRLGLHRGPSAVGRGWPLPRPLAGEAPKRFAAESARGMAWAATTLLRYGLALVGGLLLSAWAPCPTLADFCRRSVFGLAFPYNR
jgi:hypothetical protein